MLKRDGRSSTSRSVGCSFERRSSHNTKDDLLVKLQSPAICNCYVCNKNKQPIAAAIRYVTHHSYKDYPFSKG